MTIGLGATIDIGGAEAFFLAADSRASMANEASDVSIKTYSLDHRVGAVGAGTGMSCITAAELTRAIVAEHRHLQPDLPYNFYSVVRLFSYFLDKAEHDRTWSKGCEVVLTGFLSNGHAAMAKVITKPESESVAFVYAPTQPGSLISMVGKGDAKLQIAAALSRTYDKPGLEWATRAAGTIWYLCEHNGEPKIGGGISVAICPPDRPMYWPFVSVQGRTFLRGVDVQVAVDESRLLRLAYDDAWHSNVDQFRDLPARRDGCGYELVAYRVKAWVKPENAFDLIVEPEVLTRALDRTLPRATVIVGTVDEMPRAAST